MEVETSAPTQGGSTNQKSVHFGAPESIEVPVDLTLSIKQQQQQANGAPGKSRRRRSSSSGSKDDDSAETPPPRPIAPSKLRKLAEKDRHLSRSGKGRGKPKKGKRLLVLSLASFSSMWLLIAGLNP